MTSIHALRILVLLLAGLLLATPAVHAREYRYADAHLHYLDFFQTSDGIDALFEVMDASNVERVVLSGMPLAKKWHENEPQRPRYYQGDDAPVYWYSATDAIVAEAVRDLPPERRERLHLFLSGFNPNDKNATHHIETMLALYPDTWEGIGEIITRHDDLTAMIQGDSVPRANSEAMMRVYRLAAKHDLPVLLHSNLTSVREREPIYLGELEEALEKNPDTRIIWAHAGTSGEINRWQSRMPYLLPTLETLLTEHDNLWIDLSWSVLEPHVLDDGRPRQAWIELIEAHPERFLLGSDLVGRFGRLGENLQRFDTLLDALDEDTAARVAHGNLVDVLPRRPARSHGDPVAGGRD